MQPRVRSNAAPICQRLRGLDEQAMYRVDDFRVSCQKDTVWNRRVNDMTGMTFTGAQLMYAGLALPRLLGDCPALLIHFVRV